MSLRLLVFFAALSLVPASAARVPTPAAPVNLRYQFAPGQTWRYLVQRDPYFDHPTRAVETTDPNLPYKPPVVKRLTEEVLAVGTGGTATGRVTPLG